MTLTRPMRICKTFTLPLLVIALLHSLPGQAEPVAPDAGQALRELQQLPDTRIPRASPQLQLEQELRIEERTPDTSKDSKADDTRFLVKAFRISGNTEIPTGELDALVADLKGAEHNLAELNTATARITAHYRARGYAVARAYLPAQDIVDGVVSIKIIEGHVAERRLVNRSLLSDSSANGFLERIKSGDVIRTAPIDRTLRLLNDTPGVGGTRATLQPGASVGTSDLVVEINPGDAYSGSIDLDNYGNRYIGTYRLGGTLNLNSPFKIGDQLSLNALASDQHLTNGRISYRFPVGNSGLRMGASYDDTRYRLGKEFTTLKAHGKGTTGRVFATYPLMRSQTARLTSLIGWAQRNLTDEVDATSTIISKRIRLAALSLSGRHDESTGSTNNFELLLAQGSLYIDSPTALAIDNATARTNGNFGVLTYSANRLQQLPLSSQLFVSLSGQQASKNLNSSEKFSLGGANGVRAYPQDEGLGDEGYLAKLELRHNVSDNLQVALFYDTGSVTVNREPFGGATTTNSLKLSGAGIGFNATLAGTLFNASVAKRTDGGQPASIPASEVRSTTLWVQVSEQF